MGMVNLLFPVFSRRLGQNDVGVIGIACKGRCYYAAPLTCCFARGDNQPAVERAITGAIAIISDCSCLFESCNTQSINRDFDHACRWQEVIVPCS